MRTPPFDLIVSTEQEAFDVVVAHLGEQRGRAVNSAGDCVNVADDGRRCAFGCLINATDAEIRAADLEGAQTTWLIDQGSVRTQIDGYLLVALQEAHDDAASWGDDGFGAWTWLKRIADQYGLT